MSKSERVKNIFLFLFRTLLLVAMGFSMYESDWMNFFLSVLTLFFTFLPSILEKRLKIDYPEEFEIIVLVFIFASLFLGEINSFYYRFWWWDLLLHGFSSLIFGILAFSLVYILNKEGKIKLKPAFIALFAFCFALAMGAIWEVFEFSIDYFFGMNMQKSGLMDTMADMILDAMGALFISLVGFLYTKGYFRFLRFLSEDFKNLNPHLFGYKPSIFELSNSKTKG